MRTKQVRWSEGMLVLPHHFQAAEANYQDLLATSHDWLAPYAYGVRAIDVNLDALANFEVRIPRLQARLKDGSLIAVPQNGFLQTLDLQATFASQAESYVHLALPHVVPGRPNSVRRNGTQTEHRFLVDTQEWEERNHGNASRPIETHLLNVQLRALPTLESPPGFESLPILKLRRSQRPGAVPEIDPTYVPPLLACDCCDALRENVLASITSQLGAYIKSHADALRTMGGWTEANLPQVRKEITQLHAVNSSYPLLLQLFHSQGLHPFRAYAELCRLVGQLSIVRENWRPPDLPMYDHDDLGRIFQAIKAEIEELLRSPGPTATIHRFPFVGVQNWMEVGLDESWFGEGYEFFIGIRSDLPSEALEQLFGESHLDWKLGSSRAIAQIYRNAEAGVLLDRVTEHHSSLPQISNLTYFRIENEGPYWQQASQSRSLALKVNQRFVRGELAGKNTLTVIDRDNVPRELALDLFVSKNA